MIAELGTALVTMSCWQASCVARKQLASAVLCLPCRKCVLCNVSYVVASAAYL
jgi:hypothetical protein